MSWSFGFVTSNVVVNYDASSAAAASQYRNEQTNFGNPPPAETEDHITAAIAAVRTLFEHNAVGTGSFNVVLSGHANPGHSGGATKDQISVSVSQL